MIGQNTNRQFEKQSVLTDYGPEPFVVDIGRAAFQNANFRTALWTGAHLQVTLMSIPPSGEIGLEIHPDVDQLLCIASGIGIVSMGKQKDQLSYQSKASEGYAIIIPAGTWHNVTNAGNRPIKLFSVYTPPPHPRGTVHRIKAEADASEHEEANTHY